VTRPTTEHIIHDVLMRGSIVVKR